MIKKGLVKEAEGLFPNKELNALQTVGYRELFDYFEGKISLEFAVEEIKKNTRRFSKRQLTWFKRTENVAWFDFKSKKESIIDHIKSQIPIP
jgi:tRNA dimethylallyltransferase